MPPLQRSQLGLGQPAAAFAEAALLPGVNRSRVEEIQAKGERHSAGQALVWSCLPGRFAFCSDDFVPIRASQQGCLGKSGSRLPQSK